MFSLFVTIFLADLAAMAVWGSISAGRGHNTEETTKKKEEEKIGEN